CRPQFFHPAFLSSGIFRTETLLRRWRYAGTPKQFAQFALSQLQPLTGFYERRDQDGAITHPLQTANTQFLRLPQPAHFTVAAFHNYAVKPTVCTAARTTAFDRRETR